MNQLQEEGKKKKRQEEGRDQIVIQISAREIAREPIMSWEIEISH